MIGCFFALLRGLDFMLPSPTLYSTWLGPVGESYSVSSSGSGCSPFQVNARHHPHYLQYRSHAFIRSVTLHILFGLSCRATSFSSFYLLTMISLKEFLTHTTTPILYCECTWRSPRGDDCAGGTIRYRRAVPCALPPRGSHDCAGSSRPRARRGAGRGSLLETVAKDQRARRSRRRLAVPRGSPRRP